MGEKTNNKTIAQNTAYLYGRMLLLIAVSLYTSRVVLQNLGIEDYGIYQAVGGIVGFLDMVNGFMVNGVMRFLTFEMGTGNRERLHRTFCTTMYIQVGVAFIIVLLAETVGLWFLYTQMIISDERMTAAIFVFQFSIISAIFSISQVPYTSIITAHEKMSVFAGITIFDAIAKLAIVLVLPLVTWVDSLILYGFLLMLTSLISMGISRVYCIRHFEESHFNFQFDRDIFKRIAGYSLWNVISTFGTVFSGQGMVLLTNMFFSPNIVAARAISVTVSGQAIRFVQSFRQAVNPQIIKSFAAGDIERSHNLLLISTKYSFFLVLLISYPLFLVIEPMLKLWLGIVPEYTAAFSRIILVQNLFSTIVSCFYTAIYANGRLKDFVLTCSLLQFIQFPIVYVLFRMGYSPLSLSWASLIVYIVIALILDPYILVKVVGYTYKELYSLILNCFWVTLLSVPIPLFFSFILDVNTIRGGFSICMIAIINIVSMVCFFGMDADMRKKIILIIKSKIFSFTKSI